MSNSPIPPTESSYVATMAIAWEITQKLFQHYMGYGERTTEEGVAWLTKTCNRVYAALRDGNWTEEEES